jgi:hypothetical protein
MENKPSFDIGILAPVALAVLSVLGMAVVFFVNRSNVMRPVEVSDTATPFRYLYMGTEPGLSTQTPEPTATPIFLEPAPTVEPLFTPPEPPQILTSVSTKPALPTQPAVRTPTPTASERVFDDTYFEILYDGEWTGQSNVTGAYQNTLHISFETENYALFSFVGQQIIVTFQSGPSLGSILISLDGLEFEVSQSGPETQLVDWRSPVLVLGTHEIVIEHLSGGSVNLDSITIPDLSTATPTTPTP